MKRKLFSIILALAMVIGYASPALNPASQSFAEDTEKPQISNIKTIKCDVQEVIIEADVSDNVQLDTTRADANVYYLIGNNYQLGLRDGASLTWLSNTKIQVKVQPTACETIDVRFIVYDTAGNASDTSSVILDRPSSNYYYATVGDTFSSSEFTTEDIVNNWRDRSYYGDCLRNNGDGTFTALAPGKSSLHFINKKTGAFLSLVVVVKCVHVWDSGKITKPAKYYSTGVKTFTCTKCGTTKTSSIPKLDISKVKPAKVKLAGAKVSGKKLTVKWKRISKNTKGYQVALKDKKTGKQKTYTVKQGKKSTLSKTIKKLKKGRKYAVRVRAYNVVEGHKVYGPWSKAKSGKV